MALHFELVTPEKLVRSEEVYMVVVPGTEGQFGVLQGHAPFMSTVKDGALKIYRTEGATPEILQVEGGFAEVSEKGLTVLADRVIEG
ncbi:ATP synthase F1 subunit epsilon [Sphingomonas sanxanigenens]|uniref:ATP synthase epsilon chain n=1 Tax=Sphingomonas sanxanigenens DSM 19645 = NX02 TaxID=1123269 RepID=W0AB36_9SPHN|nr:ATP synthase F1 subunit epsilon [Sphingomonas sanxanigenens]AHE53508.1 F0F1 ATP synthase subunit epsilon [Sphingomonas sanxanigenens DSM 19645 = NX02]